jgi:hypothetical protein
MDPFGSNFAVLHKKTIKRDDEDEPEAGPEGSDPAPSIIYSN